MSMSYEMEEDTKSIAEYIAIVKHRKKYVIVPMIVIIALSVVAAVMWPATYRSSATILVEQQDIPRDLVRSTVTSFASQQIQVIRQRIMTLKNIRGMVEKHNLYTEEELRRISSAQLMREFDNALSLDVINAKVVDPRTGLPQMAMIAFTLAFEHASPSKARAAASELVNLYLNENLKARAQKSFNTSEFLQSELDSLTRQLKKYEQDIADYKTANKGAMPEEYQYNISKLDRAEQELKALDIEVKQLDATREELQRQLSQLSPYAPTVLPTGERVLSDQDRLKALTSDLRRKSAVYSDNHPDVVRLKREIKELQLRVNIFVSEEDYNKQLQQEKQLQSELQQKYSDGHPKLVKQRRIVEQLISKPYSEGSQNDVVATNASYLSVEKSLSDIDTRTEIIGDQKKALIELIDKLDKNISRSSSVEIGFNDLFRGYRNVKSKYAEIKSKLLQAELGQSIESERKGERFTLIEPATTPRDPISPNRPAIVVFGVMLSLAAAAGCIVLVEMLDPSIHGIKAVTELVGITPLAVIPSLVREREDDNSKNKKILIAVIGLVVLTIVVLVGAHFFYKPLDILWYVLLRRLGIDTM